MESIFLFSLFLIFITGKTVIYTENTRVLLRATGYSGTSAPDLFKWV